MAVKPPEIAHAAWLISGQTDGEPARMIPVDCTPFTIGRRSETSLTLNCPSVSGRHAELTMEDCGLAIRDLESTNGTFVNGARIRGPVELEHGDLIQLALKVFRLKIKSEVPEYKTMPADSAHQALSLIQFDKLMSERAVAPHLQPIVDIGIQQRIGFEVLGRGNLAGLVSPKELFSSAAALSQEAELSRMLRCEGITTSLSIPGNPLLFVNTHPTELDAPEQLICSLEKIRERVPDARLILEIHEAGVTHLERMRELRQELADLRIGLAYDDFGSGQARLIELVEVPPDYLKFDISLVRDIHLASAEHQGMIANLVQMASNLGIATLAEGIETEEEHETCVQLGFDYAQGFFYGRPALPATFLQS